jgi:hypothetical protein
LLPRAVVLYASSDRVCRWLQDWAAIRRECLPQLTAKRVAAKGRYLVKMSSVEEIRAAVRRSGAEAAASGTGEHYVLRVLAAGACKDAALLQLLFAGGGVLVWGYDTAQAGPGCRSFGGVGVLAMGVHWLMHWGWVPARYPQCRAWWCEVCSCRLR